MKNDKKRILLITENLGSGGAERQLCGLAVLLNDYGYRVKVVTYIENQFYEPYLRKHKVDYELLPKLANKYLRALRLMRFLRQYCPDVVISYLPSVNLAACIACLFYRTNLIVSERNTNQRLVMKDRLLFELYRLANYIVPNSYSQARFIVSHYPHYHDKIHTITNFVDSDHFVPRSETIKNAIPTIVTVARFTPQKNCLRYLEAIKIIKDRGYKAHIKWYGDTKCGDKYYQEVVDKIRDLEISDYVLLHDQSEDIVRVYQEADVFCLPSLYEGYPNVLCEAMSCGLPIICSNVCENPRIVKENMNGYLFDPLNVESMVDAMIKALTYLPKESYNIGLRNRKHVLIENSQEVFLRRYIELF